MSEYSIREEPACECGEHADFISFHDGFDNTCKKCKNENYEKNRICNLKNKVRKYELADLMKHIKQNPKEYDYEKLKNKKEYYSSFFKRYIGKYNIFSYIKRYFGKDAFPDRLCSCLQCSHEQKLDYFDSGNNFICNSKKCVAKRNKKGIPSKKEINKMRIDNLRTEYVCKIDNKKFYIHDCFSVGIFNSHIIKLGYTITSYMEKYEANKIGKCLQCGNHTAMLNSNPVKPKYLKFCCIRCYNDYKILHPEKIQNQTEKSRRKQSNTMKAKILSGEFSPKTENRCVHSTIIDSTTGIRYRSSWELIFHIIYPHLKFEHVRIEYFDHTKNSKRIYIVDFVDEKDKILYEIKPYEMLDGFNSKLEGMKKFCDINGYEYKIITQHELKKLVHLVKCDGKSKEICEIIEKTKTQFLKLK